MLRKIGAVCLALSLTGITTLPVAAGSHAPEAPALTRADQLLRLHARSDAGLPSHELAEILPELVHFDAQGRPTAVRYRSLSAVLLDELQRLADRVAELEAQLLSIEGRRPAEPLVRITVAKDD